MNSHCVAALNFHASIKTTRLSGLSCKSSRNFTIPSAVILSASSGSATDPPQSKPRTIKQWTDWRKKRKAYLCICWTAGRCASGRRRFALRDSCSDQETGRSCRRQDRVSTRAQTDTSTPPFHSFVWTQQIVALCRAVMTLTYARKRQHKQNKSC